MGGGPGFLLPDSEKGADQDLLNEGRRGKQGKGKKSPESTVGKEPQAERLTGPEASQVGKLPEVPPSIGNILGKNAQMRRLGITESDRVGISSRLVRHELGWAVKAKSHRAPGNCFSYLS